jgi:hypothetical protein
MIQALPAALAISLALTVILETGFFIAIGKRGKKDLLLVVMVNILTNPAVVLIYRLTIFYTNLNAVLVVIPLEVFAVLTEGYCYKKYGHDFKRPYLFSLSANMLSYGTGLLIQLFI